MCKTDADCGDNNACTLESCSGSPAKCTKIKESAGCSFEDSCLSLGTRKQQHYCSASGEMEQLKTLGGSCGNNYECQNNLCKNNICSEPSLIKRIINWFKSLFSFSNVNNNEMKLIDCGEDKTCFRKKFESCSPAKVKIGLEIAPGSNVLYLYEIIAPSNGGCEVKSQFLENPMSKLIGKTMVCKYDNSLDFETAIADTSKCQGELYNIMFAG